MEVWTPLERYPGYSASPQGQIRNDRRGSLLSAVHIETGHSFVGIMKDGIQVKRSISRLVAETYVPNQRPDHFTTPIHLDGNLSNCHAENLLWRPRWFALKFTRQFRLDLPHSLWPIRDRDTGDEFENPWPPVSIFGLLYHDIVVSIINRTWVFPTWQYFERAE